MNEIAERYVKLVLQLGEFDHAYVDAYYGPESWREEIRKNRLSIKELSRQAAQELKKLTRIKVEGDPELSLRHSFLMKQLQALDAYARVLEGRKLNFKEECKLLYDATPPIYGPDYFEKKLAALDQLLPGQGDLASRLDNFKSQFVIPSEKVDAVFRAAIKEAAVRTRKYLDLPEQEDFVLEYVKDKPWSGYNWYKGDAKSTIQINISLPITIDRAIDLACHEGYPGHHVYNLLLEEHLVNQKGWMEFSVYPLFSPQSLIAEGSANYGIQVAFSPDARLTFEKEVLFPLAGLDPKKAELYYEVEELLSQLAHVDNHVAKSLMAHEMNDQAAVAFLRKYKLLSREKAEQRVRFIHTYRAYVINYNHGQDLVAEYIEAQVGTADKPEKRWQVFKALLSSPRTPSDLKP